MLVWGAWLALTPVNSSRLRVAERQAIVGSLVDGHDNGLHADDRQLVAGLHDRQLGLRVWIVDGQGANGATVRVDYRKCLGGWIGRDHIEVPDILSGQRTEFFLRMVSG